MKQKLGRLFKGGAGGQARPEAGATDLRPAAASEMGAIRRADPEPFERAERLREKAERTGSDGTPSESARLRAARAREEALAALTGVRAAFVDRYGAGAAEAFDLEFEARHPAVLRDGVQDVKEP